ncbi:hypothetical protein K440DRAFT_659379 [Wilcoxina mikolae CBS 423.85]|nr:hypothetical protein K440DRAFT_659379 [Wilcoxina mikolae CBS 423.85]
MTRKRPFSIVYILIRVSQLLLCPLLEYSCGALVFYFDNDFTDFNYGSYRLVRRYAIPGRGGGGGGSSSSYSTYTSSSSSSSSSTSMNPRIPQALLLALGVISAPTALTSLSTQCCSSRRNISALKFFHIWDTFLFVLWLVGMAMLVSVMSAHHIYNKTGPHAGYYKATLALTISLMLTFLVTAVYAARLKKRGGSGDKTAVGATQSYIPVPSGLQTPVPGYSVPTTPQFKHEPYAQQQPYAPPAAAVYAVPQPQAYQTTPSPGNPSVHAPPLPQQQQYQYQQQQYMSPPPPSQQPPTQP